MKRIGIVLALAITICSCAGVKGQKKDSKAVTSYLAAYNAYRQGNTEEAHHLANKAIKKDPKYTSSYTLKAAMYDESNEIDKAISYYNQAYAVDNNPKYPFFIGEMAYRKGRYDDAVKYLNKAVSHDDFNKLKEKTQGLAVYYQKRALFAQKLVNKPVPFNPINMGKTINTANNEYFPGASIDKQTFFFTKLINRQEDLYQAVWDSASSNWAQAKGMGANVNSNANEGTVSTTIDGKYIFFTKCNDPKGVGACDIYFSRVRNGVWSKPFIIKPPLNSPKWESQPCISADGQTLYFTSNRQPSYGGMDIFKSEFKDGSFQAPVNLGPSINTKGNEQAPFIHVDGRTLYFTSDEHPGLGNNDIFISRLEADTWSTPQNLGYPINTHNNEQGIVVDRTGGLSYYTSDREGGFGGLDLYTFKLPDEFKPVATSYVKGLVTDIKTRDKLASDVDLINLKTGKTVVSLKTVKGEGNFLIALPGKQDYLLNVNNQSYLFYSDNFSLKTNTSSEPYFLDIRLRKPDAGETVVLKNIFFDTDKFDLKSNSKIELDRLVALLKRFPNLKIEIGGHTDSDGNAEANLKLSYNRSQAVMQYLISQGIDKSRLTFKGYGESKPIASNATAEGKAQNRRTEFRVISN